MNNISTGVRVLFTGQYWPGANTLYIARAFEQCGAIIRLLNDTALFPAWNNTSGKIARRLLRPLVEAEWNHQLLSLVNSFKPDLVYITNADFCWSQTLEKIRRQSIPLMCFYHDPPWKNRPGNRFSENITLFDLVASTRPWHEPEFKAAGAKAVKIVRFGYDPLAHRPIKADLRAREYYGADLTFVGTYKADRASKIEAMVAPKFPDSFRLWGGFWEQLAATSPLRPYWQGRPIHEQEIPIIYATTKIALHWVNWEPNSLDPALRKGDQHNSRTFQIPACGGAIMVAQRTDEHRQFFTEDVEAVYFDDVPELRDKLAYWLNPSHDEARLRLAKAARERCLKEDYTYVPVVSSFLNHFDLPIAKTN